MLYSNASPVQRRDTFSHALTHCKDIARMEEETTKKATGDVSMGLGCPPSASKKKSSIPNWNCLPNIQTFGFRESYRMRQSSGMSPCTKIRKCIAQSEYFANPTIVKLAVITFIDGLIRDRSDENRREVGFTDCEVPKCHGVQCCSYLMSS
jgi:hypothetical protein